MSFLTTFPEDVYPEHALAAAIHADPGGIAAAQAMMWLAQAAYETTSVGGKVARILARWGFAGRAWLSRAGTEGFVAESDEVLVVAFAGTDPVVAANWLTDFDIRIGAGGVHRGFAQGVERVWPELTAALADTTKRVFLVGHSLGGALAVVTAWRLAGADPATTHPHRTGAAFDAQRIAGVMTFGMPRAGNEAFASSYRAHGLFPRTVRLHYGSDIVPSVPPAVTGRMAYRHVGLALRCPHGGQFAASMPPREEADTPLSLSALESTFGTADLAMLRDLKAAWARMTEGGARRFPAGGAVTVLVDTLPYFLRDHVQDSYLEALGWRFASPTARRVTMRAADVDAFARELRAHVDDRLGGLARLLRGWFAGT